MRFNYKFENKKGMMPYKYDTAKIYKITSEHTDKIYIGSTTQPLKHRLWQHEYEFKRNNYNCSSRALFEYGGCKIELVEDYPCKNKEELEKQEATYMKSANVVNIRKMAGFAKNKELVKKTAKIYRDENKETMKKYRHDNNEKITNYRKVFYNNNKQKYLQKVICECGSTYCRSSKTKHINTKKHQKYLNSI